MGTPILPAGNVIQWIQQPLGAFFGFSHFPTFTRSTLMAPFSALATGVI